MHALSDAIQTCADTLDQQVYEQAFAEVFTRLDALEERLSTQRYLGGSKPSAEDQALFEILLRFDLVYYDLHKLNRTRLRDFPNLGGWLRDLYQQADPKPDLKAMQREAYLARPDLNPKTTVPLGLPDLEAPHDRWRFDTHAAQTVGTEETGRRRFAGEFVRGKSTHRDVIGVDLPAESGRYHLIVANNCPWCHRTSLVRSIRGLQTAVTMDVLYYRRDAEHGWQFRPDLEGFDADRLHGARYVRELYDRVDSTESSVPLLWDTHRDQPVNNESAEILRMFDQGMSALTTRGPELYPAEHREEIDAYNAWIYRDINNGAYKAGFTASQEAYEHAFTRFFAALRYLDEIFADRRFLCGEALTEADVRLYPTIFRFDPIYYTRMKLNLRMVRDHRHLQRWFEEVSAVPGVREASTLDHAKRGYFGRTGNNLIPAGPVLEDWPLA